MGETLESKLGAAFGGKYFSDCHIERSPIGKTVRKQFHCREKRWAL
jgi:hypothetical protein